MTPRESGETEMKTATREDHDTMSSIANRAIKLGINFHADKMCLMMDLECVHESTPLNLDRLLAADELNFTHDICGIQNHLNRTTRQLEDCFVPRLSA